MEKRFVFNGISQERFNNCFKSNEDCYEYLSNIKWHSDTFICKKCGNTHNCKGHLPFSRRCTKCKYDESPTAGTVFNKIKFPILTAFHIIFDMCCLKEGTSSIMLSEKYGIRQKTIWAFKCKIHQALNSQKLTPLKGEVFIHNFSINTRDNNEQGNIVLIAMEILPNQEIGKAYGYFEECVSKEHIQKFFEQHINIEAKVYISKDNEYELSVPKYNIQRCENHVFISMSRNHVSTVKKQLYGKHRHFSTEHIQGYLDEYYYRFNERGNKNTIFDRIITLMVLNQVV